MNQKPLTKTETRKRIADARRSLTAAGNMLTPTPAWIAEQVGPGLTIEQRRRVFRANIRGAAQALAALADYEIADR